MEELEGRSESESSYPAVERRMNDPALVYMNLIREQQSSQISQLTKAVGEIKVAVWIIGGLLSPQGFAVLMQFAGYSVNVPRVPSQEQPYQQPPARVPQYPPGRAPDESYPPRPQYPPP